MEDKRHPAHDSRERADQFSEETRSLDSFVIPTPSVSEPATQGPVHTEAHDFDD